MPVYLLTKTTEVELDRTSLPLLHKSSGPEIEDRQTDRTDFDSPTADEKVTTNMSSIHTGTSDG